MSGSQPESALQSKGIPPGLHLGVTPWRDVGGIDARALCQQAELAESLGFDSFWLPESHFGSGGNGALPEPLMLHAAIAARTNRIILGTTSFLITLRHPLQCAEQISVLDHLSDGRLIVGLGRGYQKQMLQAFDVDSKTKRARFESALSRMRDAWRGEAVAGDEQLLPLPVQQPHPPLWVAAFGPKALAQAAGLRLPYLASPVETFARLQENLALYQQALGPVPGDHAVPIMRTVFVSDDESRIASVRDSLQEQLRAQQASSTLAVLKDAASAQIDEWALIGDPQHVAQQIARYHSLGMTHMIATRLRLAEVPQIWLEDSLKLLACMR